MILRDWLERWRRRSDGWLQRELIGVKARLNFNGKSSWHPFGVPVVFFAAIYPGRCPGLLSFRASGTSCVDLLRGRTMLAATYDSLARDEDLSLETQVRHGWGTRD
jgi:hypothetical protein